MKHFILFFIAAVVAFATPSAARAAVNIFACEPEWGALAREIGGDKIDVHVATTARQNVHFLRAKPSLLAAMRRADLVFCNGASLEIGWLPVLMQKAAGPQLQQGQPGWLMAAEHVTMQNVPAQVDRSMGDVHPDGNPHIQLDPRNIATVAAVLAARLAQIDADNAAFYGAQHDAFRSRWNGMIAEWTAQARGLRGMKIVTYHDNWLYLLRWLGIDAVAALEPKPGIPPTASHLESVLQKVQGASVRAILVAPFEDDQAAQWLSGKTGIPVVRLPFTVGGTDRADRLETLFSETIRLLREASS